MRSRNIEINILRKERELALARRSDRLRLVAVVVALLTAAIGPPNAYLVVVALSMWALYGYLRRLERQPRYRRTNN